MPITPRFHLSQTSTQLIVTIHLPHVRVSASTIELVIDDSELHFHSTPYLLHLTFSERLIDDVESGREAKAVYDPFNQNGILTITVWKAEEGKWEDLDFLGRLMNPNNGGGHHSSLPSTEGQTLNVDEEGNEVLTPSTLKKKFEKISVLSSTESINGKDIEDGTNAIDEKGNSSNDSITFDDTNIQSQLNPHYGFLNMHHSVFIAYARDGLANDMLELPNPDETSYEDRRKIRLQTEREKFDTERYLEDLYLSDNYDDINADMVYVEALSLKPHWYSTSPLEKITTAIETLSMTGDGNNNKSQTEEVLNNDESFSLASIKAHIPDISKISKDQSKSLFMSLMDILFSYAYDHRTTSGDPTCESSWTIVTMSPTLSWFETYVHPYDNILNVLQWCIRRGLIYPYLRNFNFLSVQLIHDVETILSGGRRIVLRCLLQVRNILDKSEFHYLFNKLYIDPFICWVQRIKEEDLISFALEVKTCMKIDRAFDKDTMGLGLVELEKNIILTDEEADEKEKANLDGIIEKSFDQTSYSSSESSSETENSVATETDDDENESKCYPIPSTVSDNGSDKHEKCLLFTEETSQGSSHTNHNVTNPPLHQDSEKNSNKPLIQEL